MRHSLVEVETTRGPLPARVDVAIIGGGAAGIATAYHLSEKGLSVAVFEKGLIAAEQSGRNWGWCRTLGRDDREIEMAKLSVDIWRGLESKTGVDVGFRQAGVTFVTDDGKEIEAWTRWLDLAGKMGIKARLLRAEEANRTHAWQGRPWIGGITTEEDGYAEPSRAIPLLAQYLAGKGVKIYQRCAVNELIMANGKLEGLSTEAGEVRADQVVIAGGAWSSLFMRKHGMQLPTLLVHSSASSAEGLEIGGASTVRAPQFSLRPADNGEVILAKSGRGTMHIVPDLLRYGWKFREMYRARRANVKVSFGPKFFDRAWTEFSYFYLGRSPFTKCRVLDPAPDMKLVRSAYDSAGAALPGVSHRNIRAAWCGVIDNTPDGVPVVSAVEGRPGLYLCTGFSGHGFSSSMGAGHALAELIANGRSSIDLSPFSYSRLVGGDTLKPSIIY